jgi:ribosomal protein S18 acetylase RimI-like enzyme
VTDVTKLAVSAADTADIPVVRRLLREYADSLGLSLEFQGFERELAGLPGEYAAPDGALLVARDGAAIAGCVALRRLDEPTCELKRLYVRPAWRGRGVGAALADAIVGEARRLGYRRIRLDTLPGMETAQSLYERLGFREIAPYRPNPVAGARFLELDLGPPDA